MQGIIIGFREGIEIFLILTILLMFLQKEKMHHLYKYVYTGTTMAIFFSVFTTIIFDFFKKSLINLSTFAKLAEAATSIIGALFIFSIVITMIKNINKSTKDWHHLFAKLTSPLKIALFSFVIAFREGFEISVFIYIGNYRFEYIILGVLLSFLVCYILYTFFAIKHIKNILKITLFYLILQVGFLLGYALHELFSALKELHILNEGNFLLIKAFDLSKTFLSHSDGFIGLPFNIILGWYSKPEILQFLLQYLTTALLFITYQKHKKKQDKVLT